MPRINPNTKYKKKKLYKRKITRWGDAEKAEAKKVFLKHLKENFGNISYTLREHKLLLLEGKRNETQLPQRVTIYKWAREDSVFGKKMEEATRKEENEKDLVAYIEGHMWEQIREGNATLIIFALKNYAADRFKDRHDMAVSGGIAHLTYEEALKLMDKKEKKQLKNVVDRDIKDAEIIEKKQKDDTETIQKFKKGKK